MVSAGANYTVFQNDFEKTFNANPTGVWKPSVDFSFTWVRKDHPGFLFSAGLAFANYGLDFKANYGIAVANIVTSELVNLNYVQFPLSIGYHRPFKMVDPYVSVGLSPSFLQSYRFEYVFNEFQAIPLKYVINGSEKYLNGDIYQPFQLFGLLKVGLRTSFFKKWGVNFSLSYQLGLNSIENTHVLLNNSSEFWYSKLTTRTPQQASYIQYDVNSSQNTAYTTKTPTTKLSSLGFQFGFYYKF
jgi:hypothetical protein